MIKKGEDPSLRSGDIIVGEEGLAAKGSVIPSKARNPLL
jgi:hypothetical protein